METFEALRVKTSGATLAVCQYAGNGTPIVLLHGGPGFGNYLEPMAEMLSPPYWVISYDQRGCGQSSREGSFHFSEHVEDLNDLRQHLAVEKLHIFGHSWGGLLAQLYAKRYPQHVASLVLCCAAANTGKKFSAIEQKGLNERIIGKMRNLRALAWLILSSIPGMGDKGFQNLLRMAYQYYFVRPARAPEFSDVTRASRQGYLKTQKSIDETDDSYLQSLPLDASVLILQGRQDVIRETNTVLVARFRQAQNVWIEDANHLLWLENPDQFRDTLVTFYGKLMTADSRT